MHKTLGQTKFINNVCLVQLIGILSLFSCLPRTAISDVPSREEIVMCLRHQESLVETAQGEFTVTYLPTDPANIPAIKDVCRRRGKGDAYNSYIRSTEQAERMSYSQVEWRKGEKGRVERIPLKGESGTKKIRAFDGQFVRSLTDQSAEVRGIIDTAETANWFDTDRVALFSLVYEYMGDPYSRIIANNPSVGINQLQVDGETMTEVHVNDVARDGFSHVLVFDADKRVIRRDTYAPGRSPDPDESVMYQRARLSEYRSYDHASGETIWFPNRVDYFNYVGETADGTPISYAGKTVEIESVDFNTKIPDDIFVVEFPEGARVYDRVKGLGWVDSGDPHLSGDDTPSGKWLMLGNGIIAVGMVLLVAYVYIRRRKSAFRGR